MSRRGREGLQREVWDQLGGHDADWAVLTDPERRGGGWSGSLEMFYALGEQDVGECLALVDNEPHLAALDLGSGTGRLSFALARRFDRVTSVDVSRTMLAELNERAQKAGLENITSVHADDLPAQAMHDFVLSLLVLQHLPSRGAVWESLERVVTTMLPKAWLVIEIPERPLHIRARLQPRFRAYTALRRLGFSPGTLNRWKLSGISMLTLGQKEVTEGLAALGVQVQFTVPRTSHDYLYRRYVGRRIGND